MNAPENVYKLFETRALEQAWLHSGLHITKSSKQKRLVYMQEIDFIGAPKTNRTSDLPLRRGSLYPLSYRGARAF
ncbi:hypothetical protein NTG1052_700009 [Candidatus Nitrotoga sp. 1052]|nr:hypothetical protein NTG1052_700009 [Candidatus Nitrotoga sp. 1052]